MQVSTVRRRARALVVADPGRIRLRSAAGTTLALFLAMALLLVFTRIAGQPITVAMLGAVAAMQASAAVKDRDQPSRIVTTLLLFPPSIGAVAMAAVLAPLGKIADVGFIAVLFGAVWVRRFGPRGNALGMIAFISYFFGLFLRVTLDQLPVLAIAVAVGLAASLFVRTVLLPERPRVEARRLLTAFRTASSFVLDELIGSGTHDVEAVRRRLDQLGSTALLIDDWLDRYEAAKSFSVTSRELALHVFEAQIMLEQSATLAWSLEPAERADGGLGDAFAALASCLTPRPTDDELHRARRMATASLERADLTTTAGIATVAAVRATQAHLAIRHITTNALNITDHGDDGDEAEPPAGDTADGPSGLHPSTKAAIQVAVATSAATVLGDLVSPDRWYWAVLTAFLVFTGVTTRGEILSRAGHRLVGTIAGVVAGVVLAALIGHHPPIQLAVLLVCVFCAFYLVTVAYFWLTFFVTVLLAMLYGLLGSFSWEVLELRIVETAVGGVVGITAAFFVFATKTRVTFAEKVGEYLDLVSGVIDAGVEAVLAPGGDTDLVAETRRLDNALQSAITAGKPLQMGPTSTVRRGVRRLLRGLQIGNRSAHALARAGVMAQRADPVVDQPGDCAEALRRAANGTRETVEALRALVAGTGAEATRDQMAIVDVMSMPDIPPGPLRAAVRALNRLDRTLAEVTTRV